jgi:glycosyltransferase involved in cell wall biosynthesis
MTRTVAYFVESKTFGGNEEVLLLLIAGLDRDKWRPVLFHRPEPGIAQLIEGARGLGVKTQAVPWLRGWRAPAHLVTFVRMLRAEKPAIFHASLHWPLAGSAGFLAAYLAGVPVKIATVQLFVEQAWSQALILRQRIVSTMVDRYLAVSNGMARDLARVFKIPPHKLTVVFDGIKIERFEHPPNATPDLSGATRPIVMTVARLDRQKGQTFLLQAAALVPEATFVLVGDGPDRAMLEQQARQLNVADRVIFLGTRQDLPELLASCDLFVLPSLYEGLPLAVMDAMAAGKPVIGTTVTGTEQIIKDHETGILVPPGQPRPLADAIRLLLSDPQLALTLACAGQKRVREEFSAEAMVHGVTQVYEELLDKRGIRGG